MNRKIITTLKKGSLFLGALFLGWAAQAQTTNNSDTTNHHGWGAHRPGGFNHDGRMGSAGHYGRDGFAGRGAGRFEGHFRDHNGIHYTPQQRQQVAAINKDYREKSAELFKQDNLTLRQYKAGLLALDKDRKGKLSALLTPQQKEQQAERQKHRDQNVQVMAAARLERMKLQLNLNDDQVAKIKAGQEDLRNQAKAIHENDNLLPQEKREQFKALMTKRNDDLKAVLTPDQYSQFQKMFHRRPGGFGGPRGRHFGPDGHDGPNGAGGPATI